MLEDAQEIEPGSSEEPLPDTSKGELRQSKGQSKGQMTRQSHPLSLTGIPFDLRHRIVRLVQVHTSTITLLRLAMATQQDLIDEITSLRDAIQKVGADNQAVVNQLSAQIDALRAGQDTQPIIDQLEAVKALIVPVQLPGETPVTPGG